MHDARVFRNSPLLQKINEAYLIFPNFHLVWDAAYPLNMILMIPLRNIGDLTPSQTCYIAKLSTISNWKDVWTFEWKFQEAEMPKQTSDFDCINIVIAAACQLNNLILDRNSVGLEDEDVRPEVRENIQYLEKEAYLEIAPVQKCKTIVLLF